MQCKTVSSHVNWAIGALIVMFLETHELISFFILRSTDFAVIFQPSKKSEGITDSGRSIIYTSISIKSWGWF